MAYQSLYRKYRPQTFADVVGQEHVVRTLQNAITSERIAHGYLFTGTRGTAKTTIARLLAKALNCLSGGNGPVAEPCNACDACKEITAGNCIDVIELDAASHRGVADIEEVRKQVSYGPMEFRYKVFIIDEAHQLSSDAKDAFLKTLEEPPPGVVFILATTEPQSIPITIRSRCQQFDFKRGSLLDISKRLKYVLDTEGVTYTSEAINLVARGAEGSYRDSLSLLEQVLAFAPKQITAASVESVLGTLDTEQLARVTDCVARRDAPGVLALAGEILDSGKEARTLLKTLAGHFRDLLLVAVGGPAAAAELAPEDVVRLQGQVKHFAPQQILKAIDLLNEAQGETRWNNQHRLLTELTFLKLMTIGEAPDQPFATAPIVFAQQVAAVPQAAVTAPVVVQTPTPTAPPPVVIAAPVAAPVLPPPAAETASPSGFAKGEKAPVPVQDDEDENLDPVLEAALERSEEAPSLSAGYFSDDLLVGDDEDEFIPELDDEESELPTVVAPTVAPPAPSGFSLFDDDPEPQKPAAPTEPENDGLSLFDLDAPAPAPKPEPTPKPAPVAPPKPEPVVEPAPKPVAKVAPVEKVALYDDELPPPLDDDYPPLPDDEFGTSSGAISPGSFLATPSSPDGSFLAGKRGSVGGQPESLSSRDEGAIRGREVPEFHEGGEMAQSARKETPKPAPAPEPEPELELADPRITLAAVQRAWPAFLSQAEKISKKTSVMMSAATPVDVEGRTVVLSFTARMNYDMMNAPKQQEFVRKLLAKVLAPDLGTVPVRFTLSENVPPPLLRTVARQTVRRDPLAQIEALGHDELEQTRTDAPLWTPPTPAPRVSEAPAPKSSWNNASFGSGGAGRAEPAPPPDLSEELRALDPEVAAAATPGSYKARALAELLVQEILSTFGGEIVEG